MASVRHPPPWTAPARHRCPCDLRAFRPGELLLRSGSTVMVYVDEPAAPSRSAPGVEPRRALTAHDVESLSAWLAGKTGRSAGTARRAAEKAMRYLWRHEQPDPPWSDDALQQAAGIGRWARPALLQWSPSPVLQPARVLRAPDGATRLLWQLADDELVESVLIPAVHHHPRPRNTVCVSSQVGCARRCAFCESGRHGLRRQLSTAEIVDQVRLVKVMSAHAGTGPITNVVFMGMGEPLDNLAAVVRAISQLCDSHGLGLAPSRITVSTVGIADRFADFFSRTRAELAVSLGAPDDERRAQIIPATRRYGLATIRAELSATLPRGRRVLFQYALFDRFNDRVDDADRLADFVGPIRCRVNLLTANRGPCDELTAPPPERVSAFAERLHHRGVRTILRASRGADVGGACGQLAGTYRDRADEGPSQTNGHGTHTLAQPPPHPQAGPRCPPTAKTERKATTRAPEE